MNPEFRRATLFTLCLALPALAQDPVPPATPDRPDPEIQARIDEVEAAWKDRRMSRDAQVTRLLGELTAALDAPIHPDDKQAILTVCTRVLTSGKLREPTAIDPYQAAVDALARFGDEGAAVMVKTYEKKRFPRHTEWAPMRAAMLEAIGKTKASAAIPFLLERLQRSGEEGELRAAGTALGNFDSASVADRKGMVEQLAQRLASFELQAAAPAVNQDQQLNLDRENAEQMLKTIRGPFLASLRKLTDENFETGAAWQKWYQENKRKDWPDREVKAPGK